MITPAPARRPGGVAVLLAVLLLLVGTGCSKSASVARDTSAGTPVLLVHGYNPASCPGADVTKAVWGLTYLAFTDAKWRGPVLPVSYYACDRDGVDVTGYGPRIPTDGDTQIISGTPRKHYDQNASIDQLAHDLAWFVYDSFTLSDRPVDLVGISMGGLIIRDVLYRVAQHDPQFPPSVQVKHVVTFSTPYLGFGGTGASSICPVETLECQQFAVGSPLITELNAGQELPQGEGGTSWAVAGSSAGCDFVPTTSSLAPTDALRVDYLTPCYAHTAYLLDANSAADATARVSKPGAAPVVTKTAEHSLDWLVTTLSR